MPPTPITIITGFLGSGKTTLILNIIPQLPSTYKSKPHPILPTTTPTPTLTSIPYHVVALLKNEYGDLAVDSQLAASSSISGVQELLNGCICCNLVGQLSEALTTLRTTYTPDRIFIETSGSAFPATLAIEVNRIAQSSGNKDFVLDGVITVIDVDNWKGYEDTSYTAKLQARYTDLIVFTKWEGVGERRFDECLDRVGDLEVQVAWVKSDKGRVDKDLILGIDGAMVTKGGLDMHLEEKEKSHEHAHDHQSEAEVLSIELRGNGFVDLEGLETLLLSAPKDEVYRIKGLVRSTKPPASSAGDTANEFDGVPTMYVLNWAFGRWTYTPLSEKTERRMSVGMEGTEEQIVRMTMILARGEAQKWKKRIVNGGQLEMAKDGGENSNKGVLTVQKIA
jgi:G3E family GTPase